MPKHAIGKVSPQTQRLVLRVVYDRDGWTGVDTAQAANLLGMPHATALRAFDELAAIDPEWVTTANMVRRFHPDSSRKAFLQKAAPHLFNPVVREYRLDSVPTCGHLPLSGMSAIGRHSMLTDNPYPTFAVTKAQERELDLGGGRGLTGWNKWDEPACAIQVMRYELDSLKSVAIDPVSAILSLSDEETEDPCIERAVVGILERVLAD